MNTRFSLHFFLRKASYHTIGALPIYLHITVGGKRSEISIQRDCLPERWNAKASRMIGTKEDAREINAYIETITGKVYEIHRQLVQDDMDITADVIRARLTGESSVGNSRKILEVFVEHNRDFEKLVPKLSSNWSDEHKLWLIKGQLDICDVEGNYWDTFDIAILVPKGYPYAIPILVEVSTKIPRDIDWHISSQGVCCLDEEHVFIAWSKTGIYIKDFLVEKVYPYLANQLYKIHGKRYAGKEYQHFSAGMLQYYQEELEITSPEAILKVIEKILQGKVERNELCPCGSIKKVKKCHYKAIETMGLFGKQKLIEDRQKLLELIH